MTPAPKHPTQEMPPARKAVMQNHHEKTRDMARSVLPSKLTVKQWRRQIHHRERSRVRAELHRARYSPGDLDDFSDTATGVDRTKHEISEMVLERRDADKLGPLLRWAEYHNDHDPALRNAPVADRLEHFASRLPDGLIGSHAMIHIAWHLYRVY
jgi:hypothetical protein